MLNYTTKVTAQQSIGEISKMLAKAGAKAVMHEYDDSGNIKSLSFQMKFGDGEVGFRLPANIPGVRNIILEMRKQGNTTLRPWMLEDKHFEDVTWRVIKDWIEAQLALIEAEQAKTEQVFLPYAITAGGQTLYEQMALDPRLLLGGGQ